MKQAIIIGDTRGYHLGSLLNCTNLIRLVRRRYHLLGIYGGIWFKANSYADFVRKAKRWAFLRQAAAADVVFCNGEGLLEPCSPYGCLFRSIRTPVSVNIRTVAGGYLL